MTDAMRDGRGRLPDRYEVFAFPKEYPDDGPRSNESDPAEPGGGSLAVRVARHRWSPRPRS